MVSDGKAQHEKDSKKKKGAFRIVHVRKLCIYLFADIRVPFFTLCRTSASEDNEKDGQCDLHMCEKE